MKYDVHLYAVVRVKIAGVAARNENAAAKTARRLVNLDDLFNTSDVFNPHVESVEFDDTITHVLVEPAGNGKREVPAESACFEPFGKGGLTRVPFDDVSTHVAVMVTGGNVESIITNRPCQVVVLDYDNAIEPGFDIDEETEFHGSEVDPWLSCEQEFKAYYNKERAHDSTAGK